MNSSLRLLRISDNQWVNLDQVTHIRLRGDVLDFHLISERGVEQVTVSTQAGEWTRKLLAWLESLPHPDEQS
jgi:DNA-binding LytR/AlgR family response regulator